jgi:hypothetical protein
MQKQGRVGAQFGLIVNRPGPNRLTRAAKVFAPDRVLNFRIVQPAPAGSPVGGKEATETNQVGDRLVIDVDRYP